MITIGFESKIIKEYGSHGEDYGLLTVEVPYVIQDALGKTGFKDGQKVRVSITDDTTTPRRIYISGPISGSNKEECIARFKKVQQELEADGWQVFNPMENGLPFDADTHQHMHRDLAELTNEDHPYDAIYMMRRWVHSKGCKVEFDVATAMGLRVAFEEVDAILKFE